MLPPHPPDALDHQQAKWHPARAAADATSARPRPPAWLPPRSIDCCADRPRGLVVRRNDVERRYYLYIANGLTRGSVQKRLYDLGLPTRPPHVLGAMPPPMRRLHDFLGSLVATFRVQRHRHRATTCLRHPAHHRLVVVGAAPCAAAPSAACEPPGMDEVLR